MFEAIIMMLIYLCLFAVIVFVVLYVLGQIGIVIPPRVLQLLWVVAALVVMLLIFRMLAPALGGLHFPAAHAVTVCEGYRNC